MKKNGHEKIEEKEKENKTIQKARINAQLYWYMLKEVFRWRFFLPSSPHTHSPFPFLLLIDAFTRVNICVNKCSLFFNVHVCPIDVDALSICTHIHHTYAYYRIVIKAFRMRTYSSISRLFFPQLLRWTTCTCIFTFYITFILEKCYAK